MTAGEGAYVMILIFLHVDALFHLQEQSLSVGFIDVNAKDSDLVF